MDGENNGKPYEQMDDLGGNPPYFWKQRIIHIDNFRMQPTSAFLLQVPGAEFMDWILNSLKPQGTLEILELT